MQKTTTFWVEISMEGLQLGTRSIPIAVWYLGKYLEILVLNLIKKYGDTHHENRGKTSLRTDVKTQAVMTGTVVLQWEKMVRRVQDGRQWHRQVRDLWDTNEKTPVFWGEAVNSVQGATCHKWLDAASGISLVHLLPLFPEATTTIKALCKTWTCFSAALGMKILIIVKQNKNWNVRSWAVAKEITDSVT